MKKTEEQIRNAVNILLAGRNLGYSEDEPLALTASDGANMMAEALLWALDHSEMVSEILNDFIPILEEDRVATLLDATSLN